MNNMNSDRVAREETRTKAAKDAAAADEQTEAEAARIAQLWAVRDQHAEISKRLSNRRAAQAGYVAKGRLDHPTAESIRELLELGERERVLAEAKALVDVELVRLGLLAEEK